jgi:phage shock protein E
MNHRSPLARVLAAGALGLGAMLGLTSCSGSPDATSQSAQTVSLGTAAFSERMAADDVVVLDVRTPAEFDSGHLATAINIDVEAPDFETRIAELDPTVPYAIYCRSGNRSAVAMNEMAQAGFTDLADLSGGITAWIQDGRPIAQ